MGEEIERANLRVNYVYTGDDNTLTVDPREFQMISEFLKFIRNRERGTFTAEIVTHQKRRFVMIDKTDRIRIDLNEVVDDE